MQWCEQAGYSAGGVPSEPLAVVAPMRLQWRTQGGGAPLICARGIAVRADGGITWLSHSGEVQWSSTPVDSLVGLRRESVLHTVGHSSDLHLVSRRVVDGVEVSRDRCELTPTVMFGPEGRFGSTTVVQVGREFQDWVGVGSTESGVAVTWRQRAPEGLEFSRHVVADGERLFVGRGADLVALGIEDGRELWATRMEDGLGGAVDSLHWWLMVADGVVVTNTRGGTAAYAAATGELLWATPGGGARAICGDGVYFMHEGAYQVLDLHSGAVRLSREVAREIEEKWGLEQVQFKSHPAVSETHTFVGDARGRLFALVRDTGEPVWYDQPPGVTSFWGALPVIANRRLYISSFSIDAKRPPYLYCYEEAPEGSWEPPTPARKRPGGRVGGR